MRHNEHNAAQSSRNCLPTERQSPLQWLSMSFTGEGLTVLKAYRAELSRQTRGPITLAKSLDTLIKSHPFATGAAE